MPPGKGAHLSPRKNRITHNEELFRQINAHIAELENRLVLEGEPLPLVCECANTECVTVIEVEPAVFTAVREHPLRFLVAPGHEGEDETVVVRNSGYLIVEKQPG
jgi:hypothetical protein